MYKNFEEYQKRYFEKYYKQVSKIETNKKYSFSLFAKQFSFLSFVLVFSYFVLFYDVNVNSKYNSEEVNMMYSQKFIDNDDICLLYTSPSPRDKRQSRMPSSA